MTVAADEARLAAIRVLQDVLENGAYANLSSIRQLESRRLTARDRAFASALIYGTISRLPALDYLLEKVLDRPLAKLDPAIRTILRAGAWQLYHAHAVPPSAAVNESVKLAQHLAHPGAASLVNACLRRLSAPDRPELPANKPALAAGLPSELFGYLKKWYGRDEAVALAAAALENLATTTVRANVCRTTTDQLQERLSRAGVVSEPGLYCPEALRLDLDGRSIRSLAEFQEGLLTVQDEAAMLVAHIADPKPGWRVIDLCAAPGGKTTHVAETMNDQGQILALDLSPSRLALVDEQATRLGLQAVRTAAADATATDWTQALLGQADLVLADVPCSGLGLLARKPEIRLTMTHEKITGLIPLQRQILSNAATLVRPGGVLVYSTCTINPDENVHQIEQFLASEQGMKFQLETITPFLPVSLLEDPEVAQSAASGWIQLLPHRHHTDGFFMARLRRRPIH
ncbi:MAG: 16S rRNA (cytosine(967)-C(5))-methyltransferase RsmB [Clostridia bacterium]|nr:16S rRNA (cytosine(967)-C(5))-methyltransferase RsmB [Clostridia bacterium]